MREPDLDGLGILGDSTSSNSLGTPYDPSDTLCNIAWVCLRFWRLLNSDDEVRNDMCRNLSICLNQGREEYKQGVKRRTRHERRISDLIDVRQEFLFDFRERYGRG